MAPSKWGKSSTYLSAFSLGQSDPCTFVRSRRSRAFYLERLLLTALSRFLTLDDEEEDSSTPPSSPPGPVGIPRRGKFDDEEEDSDVGRTST